MCPLINYYSRWSRCRRRQQRHGTFTPVVALHRPCQWWHWHNAKWAPNGCSQPASFDTTSIHTWSFTHTWIHMYKETAVLVLLLAVSLIYYYNYNCECACDSTWSIVVRYACFCCNSHPFGKTSLKFWVDSSNKSRYKWDRGVHWTHRCKF